MELTNNPLEVGKTPFPLEVGKHRTPMCYNLDNLILAISSLNRQLLLLGMNNPSDKNSIPTQLLLLPNLKKTNDNIEQKR